MIYRGFPLKSTAIDWKSRIEWGKFQSMGETFEILASDVEKLVIFQ